MPLGVLRVPLGRGEPEGRACAHEWTVDQEVTLMSQ